MQISISASCKFWLLCAFWGLCSCLHAQNLDSLENIFKKAKVGNERLDALKMLIDASMNQDMVRATKYVGQMQEMAQRAGSEYHLGIADERQGSLSYLNSKVDSARVQYKLAYEHYRRANRQEEALLAYTRIGIMYSLEGKFSDAARIYDFVRMRAGKKTKVNAFLFNQLGTLYHYQANVDSAGYYYAKSEEQYKVLKDTVGLLRPMYNHAALLVDNNQPNKAKPMLYIIKDLQERLNAWEDASYTYSLLSNLLMGEGDFEESLVYAQKLYEYAKTKKDESRMMTALLGLGKLKNINSEPAAAIPYLKEALAIAEKGNIWEMKQAILMELGTSYFKMKVYDKAEDVLTASIQLSENHNDSRVAPSAISNLGMVYYHTGRLKEAKQWLQKALDMRDQNQSHNDLALIYGVMANIHLEEKQPRLAISMAEKGYALTKEADYYGTLPMELTNTLFRAYKEAGDFKTALQYHETYKQLADTLYNVEKAREQTTLLKDFEFNLEKEQLETERRQSELLLKAQARQNSTIALSVGALGLLGFGFFWNARRKNLVISEKNLQLEQLNTTKDRIFAIIGHDLRKPALAFRGITVKINYLLRKKDFSTLNALGGQIEQDAQALHQLTDNLLSWALAQKNVLPYNPAALSLRTEAEEVLALFQSVAAHKQITLLNEIPDHQEVYADKNTLHTILRNLLDNAIKFSHPGGAVSLSTASSEEGVVIKIADTGTGIPQEKLRDIFLLQKGKNEQGTAGEKGAGLGLHLVWEMVQLNRGKIEMFSQPNQGTEVRLLLPAA